MLRLPVLTLFACASILEAAVPPAPPGLSSACAPQMVANDPTACRTACEPAASCAKDFEINCIDYAICAVLQQPSPSPTIQQPEPMTESSLGGECRCDGLEAEADCKGAAFCRWGDACEHKGGPPENSACDGMDGAECGEAQAQGCRWEESVPGRGHCYLDWRDPCVGRAAGECSGDCEVRKAVCRPMNLGERLGVCAAGPCQELYGRCMLDEDCQKFMGCVSGLLAADMCDEGSCVQTCASSSPSDVSQEVINGTATQTGCLYKCMSGDECTGEPDECPREAVDFCTSECLPYTQCAYGGAEGLDCNGEAASKCGEVCQPLMAEHRDCVCESSAGRACTDQCQRCIRCVGLESGAEGCEGCDEECTPCLGFIGCQCDGADALECKRRCGGCDLECILNPGGDGCDGCTGCEECAAYAVQCPTGEETSPSMSTKSPVTTSTVASGPRCDNDNNCFTCEDSGLCSRCQNEMYLRNGRCVEDCPLVSWGEAKRGRECRDPFVCKAAEGCECPLGGCLECNVGVQNVTCVLCREDRFLASGKCRKDLTCRGSTVRPLAPNPPFISPDHGANCCSTSPFRGRLLFVFRLAMGYCMPRDVAVGTPSCLR